MKVTVLGSGSWGTALTILLARNGHSVRLLGRNEEEIASLARLRENLQYLPGFAIPQEVEFGLLDHSPEENDMTVVAVPSNAVRDVVREVAGAHPLVVVCAKGLEPITAKLMAQVVQEVLPEAEVGVLSGPNLAVEIARGVPTVAVSAFASSATGEAVRDAFNCSTFRVSVSDDVVGVELGGALKNVLAIGAGMSDGLGFGDNTKGAFVCRGLMEMAKLGMSLGGRMETFLGPAGVGDLFATASSKLSRNYRLGRALGEGSSLEDALQNLGQVAEGVPTCESAQILARRASIDLPVFAAVEAVLHHRVTPRQAVALLMERQPKASDFYR